MKTSKILAAFLLVLLVLSQQAALADWPMAGANPQRTSWVPEEVKGTLHVNWYRPIEAFIQGKVNLVAANNRIYVSTARGLVILDYDDGSVLGRFDTQIPLGNAPTISGSYAYVPGLDRTIYKLNSLNGSYVDSFTGAKAGFHGNPLVINDSYTGNEEVIFVGGRDGYLYAIDADTMNKLWQYPADSQPPLGPIAMSPAYNNGIIYFVANNTLRMYAVNTSGTLQWISPVLKGMQYQSYWPVVYEDKIMVFGSPPYSHGTDIPGMGVITDINDVPFNTYQTMQGYMMTRGLHDTMPIVSNPPGGDWHHGQTVYDGYRYSEYYEDNPEYDFYWHKPFRRPLMIINNSDGSEYSCDVDGDSYPDYAPIYYHGTRSGNASPPLVGSDGVTYFCNYFNDTGVSHVRMMGWLFGTRYLSSISTLRTAFDEPSILSSGGTVLYRVLCCDREAVWADVDGGTGTLWSYSLSSQAPGYGIMWYDRSGESGLWGGYGNVNGIYHDHGDQNPLIPYNGNLYVHRSNCIICYGPDPAVTTPLALLEMDDEKVDTITAPTVNDLTSRLESEIQKIVDAGNLKPGYYNRGQAQPNWYDNYFVNPGDTLHVLLRAYPLISNPTLTSQLESYLQSQWSEYFSPTMYADKGWSEGAYREDIDYPPDLADAMTTIYKSQTTSSGWGWTYPQRNFYAMWKYAQLFPSETTNAYNLAKSKITLPPLALDATMIEQPWIAHGYMAGYYGFLQLQTLAGQEGDTVNGWTRAQIQAELDRVRALRINNFEKDTPWNNDNKRHWKRYNVARNFMWITPEIGDYMYQNIYSAMQVAMKEYNWVAAYWFLSRFEADTQEGCMGVLDTYHALFQAKAYALKESYQELTKYLDVPAFPRGDLFYIDNLIAAIEVGSGANQAPSVDAGSSQQITLPDDDVSLNGTVTDDGLPDPPGAFTVTWSKDSGPGTVTFGNDNAVDTTATFSTDGVYILRLTANDSQLTNSDTVTITVNPSTPTNQAPSVSAGNDQLITLPTNTASLDGTVTDDGLPDPPGAVTQTWTKESGVGTVTFANANAVDTTATFSEAGVYVLRLTANDSELSDYDEMTVTVNSGGGPGGMVQVVSDIGFEDNYIPTIGIWENWDGTTIGTWFNYGTNYYGEFHPTTGDTHSGTYKAEFDSSVHDGSRLMQVMQLSNPTVNGGDGTLECWIKGDVDFIDVMFYVNKPPNSNLWTNRDEYHRLPNTEETSWTYRALEFTIGGEYNWAAFRIVGKNATFGYCLLDDITLEIELQGAGEDTDPPTPDPLTWATVPYATGTTSISMTATTASDPCGVEYYFDCTAGGGNDSGWQDSTTYEDTGLSPSTQYTYRVQARDKSANQNTGGWSSSESATTDTPPDTSPPTPDPLTWATVPYSTGTTSISMTATTASDPSGVEYYFECTAGGGNDSGWQDGAMYEDTGLSPSTQYTYRVQARDKSANQNTGGWSTSESATTDTPPDTTPPTPNPLTWATVPYSTGTTSISMTATTASDPSGVEYFFDCTAGGGNDSGWQDSTTYEDTGLSPSTQYTYRVQPRDKSANQNAGGWSTSESATTDTPPDTTPPTPDPITWATMPYATGTTSISMTATTASDPSGVEYYFDCTAGGGNDSGWQDSTTYEDTGLSPSTQYTYRVQARDKSANQNAGGWSTSESATTDTPPDTTPPTPDPLTWATVPYATGTTSISMTATTASDPSGVEYFFDCTAGGGNDSGWQDGTTYEDTGLDPNTQYTYRVQARDKSANQNTGAWSTSESATTQAAAGGMVQVVSDTGFEDNYITTLGGYETWDGTTIGTWFNYGTNYYGEFHPTTGDTHSGTYKADLDSSVHDGSRLMQVMQLPNPTVNGGDGTFEYWMKGDIDFIDVMFYVNKPPNSNLFTARDEYHRLSGAEVTSWTQRTLEFTIGGEYNWAAFRTVGRNSTFGYCYLDDVTLEIELQGAADTEAPTPDPLTWSTVPYATGTTSISMTATTASDPSGVEYYFECTAGGGNDSGWQDSTTYEDTGLSPSTQYTYRVQARDKSANQNAGGWSTAESATTDTPPDTTPPTPDPLTWATAPYATGTTSILMTATTASDPSGVEYYFDCTAGGGNDSAWQDSTTYEDTGLSPSTQYTYRVQARDKSANQNAGGWSTSESATTDSGIDPNLIAWWEMENNADDSADDHDGTVSGPTFVTDSGYCIEFDGDADDRVTVSSSTDFDGPTGTWMMWIRTDGTWGIDGGSGGPTVMGSAILMGRHDATSSHWGTHVSVSPAGTVTLQCKNAVTLTTVSSTGTVTNDAWRHIAVTWDQASGGYMRIYIDGSPDGSATNSGTWAFANQDLLLGDSPDSYWEEFAGRMDDVRVYDYELSQSEINAIYQQGR